MARPAFIDEARVVAWEIAKTYCDDHMSYFAHRNCALAIVNKLMRENPTKEDLLRLDQFCHQQAKKALARGGYYVPAYKACIDAHLNGKR